jgi:hypothetical protein
MQKQEQRTPARPGLSSDELASIIKEAARRQGEDLKRDDTKPVSTIDDAYAVARELGIPDEYVTEAAGDLQARRFTELQVRQIGRKRLTQLVTMLGLGIGVVALVWMLGIGWLTFLGVAGLAGLVIMVALIRWLSVAIGDPGLKQIGSAPVPGRCRVCGREAVAPESTFCDEHRYKSPAELKGSGE